MKKLAKKFGGDQEATMAQFAALPWVASANEETLTVRAGELSKDQIRLLAALLKNDDVAVKFSQHSRALEFYGEEPVENSTFTFYPPREYAPVLQKFWDAALPAAERRMLEKFSALAALPWQYTHTADKTFYLEKEKLGEAQLALLEDAPRGTIKKDPFSFLHCGAFEVQSEARHYLRNRFQDFLQEKFEREIERDSDLVAALPWSIDKDGCLTLDRKILEGSVASGDHALGGAFAALRSRGISEIGGVFLMAYGNRAEKLWDSPDGETDWGRMECYHKAAAQAIERLRAAYAKLAAMPWQFDTAMQRFFIRSADFLPDNNYFFQTLPEGFVYKAVDGNLYLEEPPFVSLKMPEGYGKAIAEFRAALKEKFSNLDLGGLETLSWKRDSVMGGLRITQKEFEDSGLPPKLLEIFPEWHEGDIVIYDDHKIGKLPFTATLEAAAQKRAQEFVAAHEEDIRALPWVPTLKDKITDYNAVMLFNDQIPAEQRALADELLTLGLLHNHINKEYWPQSKALLDLLEPHYAEANAQLIDYLAGLPWRHVREGVSIAVAEKDLNPAQAEFLSRLRCFRREYNSFRLSESRARENNYNGEALVMNDLRAAIGQKTAQNALAPKLPEAITSLKWRFGGFHGDREIVLDARHDINEAQKKLVQETLPQISFFDFFDSAKFTVAEPGSDYMMRAVLEGPVYQQLLPAAQRQLAATIEGAAALPWRKTSEGAWELTDRDLSKAQQGIVRQLPGDFLARDSYIISRYTGDHRWRLNAQADDDRLFRLVVEKNAPASPSQPVPAP